IGQAVDEDDRHAQVGDPVRGESIVDHQGHIRLFGWTFTEAVMQTQQVFRQAGYTCVTEERNVGIRQLVQNETEFAYPAPAIVPDCSKEREFWPVGRHVVCRGPRPPSSACRGAIKHTSRTRAIRDHPNGARKNIWRTWSWPGRAQSVPDAAIPAPLSGTRVFVNRLSGRDQGSGTT